jgi:hypothetical protein
VNHFRSFLAWLFRLLGAAVEPVVETFRDPFVLCCGEEPGIGRDGPLRCCARCGSSVLVVRRGRPC